DRSAGSRKRRRTRTGSGCPLAWEQLKGNGTGLGTDALVYHRPEAVERVSYDPSSVLQRRRRASWPYLSAFNAAFDGYSARVARSGGAALQKVNLRRLLRKREIWVK